VGTLTKGHVLDGVAVNDLDHDDVNTTNSVVDP